MNPLLEERLRAVYAKGYLELTDVEQCDFSYLDPLEAVLQAQLAPWGVGLNKFCVWSQLERVASTSISLWAADGVPWKAGRTRPHQRLAETGQPGVVCILTVSTVYPAWDCYFNLWTPRDDPSGAAQQAGYLDCAMLDEAGMQCGAMPVSAALIHGRVVEEVPAPPARARRWPTCTARVAFYSPCTSN